MIELSWINVNTGDRYGRLTVLGEVGRDKHNKRCLSCLCDCGNTTVVELNSIRTGNTTSCGCYALEVSRKINTTHGKTKTCLYNSWRGMKDRCINPNSTNYSNYGGRGIKVCDEWQVFDEFLKWAINNGYVKGLSIERINNNGNYEPGNCRWATRIEQNNNRRTNHMITFNGKTKSTTEWSRITGINYRTLKSRLETGWTVEDALLTPTGAIKTGPKPKNMPVYVAE